MLQNYKEQKHIIQQKHIEILQKKKDEASLMKQRKNNEIIKIKQDIDTYVLLYNMFLFFVIL
jgi:hypothetical protein